MNELEIAREEYKNTYKKYIIKTTGSWTPQDEENLKKNMMWIEFKSGLMAWVIVGMILSALALILTYVFHLAGVI